MYTKTLAAGIIMLSTAVSATSVFAAQQNSIRFKGEVLSQTCNISINDSTAAAPIILLPSAKVSDLSAANKTSSPTTFSMKLTGCTQPTSSAEEIKVRFVSNNVDTNGNLKNIATSSPADNVAIQLLDPDSQAINLSSGEAVAKGFTLPTGATSAEAQYTAQYIATGAATAGNVEASVQYSIDYQ